MKKLLQAVLLAPALVVAEDTGGHLSALKPEFHKLVNASAVVEKVTDGFEFTEGPVWSPKHLLLFSDIYGDRIYQWQPGGGKSVFRESAGNPNGLTFDQQGRLLICEQKKRRIVRLSKSGEVTVLAHEWEGKALNCPNDCGRATRWHDLLHGSILEVPAGLSAGADVFRGCSESVRTANYPSKPGISDCPTESRFHQTRKLSTSAIRAAERYTRSM
jgi:hypothetical protein